MMSMGNNKDEGSIAAGCFDDEEDASTVMSSFGAFESVAPNQKEREQKNCNVRLFMDPQ